MMMTLMMKRRATTMTRMGPGDDSCEVVTPRMMVPQSHDSVNLEATSGDHGVPTDGNVYYSCQCAL